ncbi:MAG: hopanoid biosynthesis-associated protein HpnK [Acidiferrobacteraceae bacterium]
MKRRVIITADDFGLALAVNEAVEIAHCKGVLAGASLMMGEAATEDAVARAKRLPSLRVGLHVVVVDGRPVLSPERIPGLVGADGRFDDRLLRAGLRFFCLPRVRRQLDAEIRAQFEAFRATGLKLDHVNAHKHMHLHPTIVGMILRIGRDYGMGAMRLPYEPHFKTRGHRVESVLMAPWIALLRWRLRRAGVRFNEFVFGLSASGSMTEEIFLHILHRLPSGVSEIYFHPATQNHPDSGLPMAVTRHDAELKALISPKVRAMLEGEDFIRTGFGDLR